MNIFEGKDNSRLFGMKFWQTEKKGKTLFDNYPTANFNCDGRFVSKNCLKYSQLKECKGCGQFLCKNCFTEHQEEVNDD